MRRARIDAQRYGDIFREIEGDCRAIDPDRLGGIGIAHVHAGAGAIGHDFEVQFAVKIAGESTVKNAQVVARVGRIIDRIIGHTSGVRVKAPVAFAVVIGKEQPLGLIGRNQPEPRPRGGVCLNRVGMADACGFHNQHLIGAGAKGWHASQRIAGPVTLVAIGAAEVQCAISPNAEAEFAEGGAVDAIAKTAVIYHPASGIKLRFRRGGKIPVLRKQHSRMCEEGC